MLLTTLKNRNLVYNIESIFFFHFRPLGSTGKVFFLYSAFMKSNDRNAPGNCVPLWSSARPRCKAERGYHETGDHHRCTIYKIALGIWCSWNAGAWRWRGSWRPACPAPNGNIWVELFARVIDRDLTLLHSPSPPRSMTKYPPTVRET